MPVKVLYGDVRVLAHQDIDSGDLDIASSFPDFVCHQAVSASDVQDVHVRRQESGDGISQYARPARVDFPGVKLG